MADDDRIKTIYPLLALPKLKTTLRSLQPTTEIDYGESEFDPVRGFIVPSPCGLDHTGEAVDCYGAEIGIVALDTMEMVPACYQGAFSVLAHQATAKRYKHATITFTLDK